ncbi:MAG: MFS transporter [Bdellovibrionales bacterium]|nr:MFS transporter [Bdellovibrionales bacterium]
MNPVILKVGLISFFADLSSELLYPITPLFITGVLHASMTSLGAIEGFAELTASLLKGWAGKKSDELGGRKKFVWGGYLISTLSKASIGLATSWVGVLIARSLDRVGKGIRTAPRDALIAEAVPKEQLGFAFGVHRGMDTLGAVLGPLFAVFLLGVYGEGNLRNFYIFALIPGLLAVGLATRLPEAVRKVRKKLTDSRAGKLSGLPRSYFIFMLGWGIFSFVNSSDAFLILRTQNHGNGLVQTVLMYCTFNLVYALSSPFLGKLSDRYGKLLILKWSLLVFSLVYFGFGFGINPWFLFPVYGLFMGMSEGVGKALVADLVPDGKQGELGATAQGFFGMVTGISALGASLIAGLLWDQFGQNAPFFYGGIGAILSLIVFLVLR